jgi:hypothetical protein
MDEIVKHFSIESHQALKDLARRNLLYDSHRNQVKVSATIAAAVEEQSAAAK